MGTRSAPACEVGSIGGAAGFVGERYGMGQLVDMRLLAERSPGGLFATDLSGVCLYVNPAGDAICGSEAGRSVGRPWAEALRLEDPGIVMASWREVASAGYGGVFLIRTPEGAQRWIEVRTAPAADTEAESGGHSGIILDVTDAWVMERRVTTRDAVTRILASPVSRESACEGILREIGGILGWGGGVFWELDAQGKRVRRGWRPASRASKPPSGIRSSHRGWDCRAESGAGGSRSGLRMSRATEIFRGWKRRCWRVCTGRLDFRFCWAMRRSA